MSKTNQENEEMVMGDTEQSTKKIGRKMSRKTKIVIGALILVLLGVGGFFFNKYSKTPAYQQKKADRESKALVQKISRHMILPEGTPAIFDVQDPDTLTSQQAFFKGAEKGDSLLVYAEAGKAIIYSKKRDVIVNVGPVTFDQAQPQTKTSTPTKKQ